MSETSTAKPVVLTGIKPTGKLHIGNYVGALSQWVKGLDEKDNLFFLADLHSLTITPDPKGLRNVIRDVATWYLACGLDPKRCHIFLQSHVTGHTELAWVLGCLTPVGQMERMTQYKDYLAKGINAYGGILYYPVLMAADILMYNADEVPVGEDQKQHVELTRDLAEKFNRTYCDKDNPYFRVPRPVIGKVGARIMSLQEPTKKMSKSDEDNGGCILLEDQPAVIRKKIMRAVTDSGSEVKYDEENKPGVSNLLSIMSVMGGKSIAELEAEFEGKRYGDFKKAVAETVVEALEPIQKRYAELAAQPEILDQVLADGAAHVQPIANKIIKDTYEMVGLIAPKA